jgi:hypothetical protein
MEPETLLILNFESTQLNPKNEIATKTQRHQGSPRVYISIIYSWCNFVPWSLGGKKRLFGADSTFYFKLFTLNFLL